MDGRLEDEFSFWGLYLGLFSGLNLLLVFRECFLVGWAPSNPKFLPLFPYLAGHAPTNLPINLNQPPHPPSTKPRVSHGIFWGVTPPRLAPRWGPVTCSMACISNSKASESCTCKGWSFFFQIFLDVFLGGYFPENELMSPEKGLFFNRKYIFQPFFFRGTMLVSRGVFFRKEKQPAFFLKDQFRGNKPEKTSKWQSWCNLECKNDITYLWCLLYMQLWSMD